MKSSWVIQIPNLSHFSFKLPLLLPLLIMHLRSLQFLESLLPLVPHLECNHSLSFVLLLHVQVVHFHVLDITPTTPVDTT